MNPQKSKVGRLSKSAWRLLSTAAYLLMCIFWSNPVAAGKQFCLDDNDLKSVLVAAFLSRSGGTLGVCEQNFPPLRTMASEIADQFHKTYATVIDTNAHVVKEILSDHGMSEYDQGALEGRWAGAGFNEASNYSLQQCRSFIMFLKGMAVLENFDTVETFALENFNLERQKVAKCSSNQ